MNGHSLPGAKKALLVKFAEDHHRRIQRQEMAQVRDTLRALLASLFTPYLPALFRLLGFVVYLASILFL